MIVKGWAKADPHFLRCFDMRLALLRQVGAEAYLRAQPIFLYPADWITAHSDALDAELPHQLASFPGAETMEKRIAALMAFDIGDRLGTVSTPMLTLTAQDDMLVPWTASDFALSVPGAKSARIEWGGHACNVTDPVAFQRIVREYLRS